ncbi:MAG: ATP-binding protein [Candidatus Riflebacteria bacterium]|nr:ATP-binding protein [Candidatus Riflebacteria bacterium]
MAYLAKPATYSNVFKFPAKLNFASSTRDKVRSALEKKGVPAKLVFHICLCLDEALTNAIEHGSTTYEQNVELGYRIERDFIEISVTDSGGLIFDPEYFDKLATVKDWGVGGRGILLIRSFMDEVYFVFTPKISTRVIMRKKIDPIDLKD